MCPLNYPRCSKEGSDKGWCYNNDWVSLGLGRSYSYVPWRTRETCGSMGGSSCIEDYGRYRSKKFGANISPENYDRLEKLDKVWRDSSAELEDYEEDARNPSRYEELKSAERKAATEVYEAIRDVRHSRKKNYLD